MTYILEYEWTDERDEDNVRERTFIVKFKCLDAGFSGSWDEPAYGPEFDIISFVEVNNDGTWGEVDQETRDLIESSDHFQENLCSQMDAENSQ